MRATGRYDAASVSSGLNELLLVVDLRVKPVEVSNEAVLPKWKSRVGVASDVALKFERELLPLLVEILAFNITLLDRKLPHVIRAFLESFLEGDRIDFLENSLERYQGLLENLMPVIISEIDDDGH